MFDVIIPTYYPTKTLLQLIQDLDQQTEKPGKIILMNTCEDAFEKNLTKQQASEIRNHPKVELNHVKKAEFNHGSTRNQGFFLSNARYAVCLTQDVTLKNSLVMENLIRPLQSRHVVVSYARQFPYDNCKPEEKYIRSFNYPAESRLKTKEDISELGIKAFFCSNVCAAYDKQIFDTLGGFPESVIFNEDMIFAAKALDAGYIISYTADAEVYHSHKYSNRVQFQRNFDLGVSHANHPEVFARVVTEKEGFRMVKDTIQFLNKSGKWYRVPFMLLTTSFKYLGFFLGKRYRSLPRGLVIKCSMNNNYWTSLRQDEIE